MVPDPADTFSVPSKFLLEHWQGHRRVTRRVIEAFPESELFSFAVGGMRPFAQLAFEMVGMTRGGIRGVATGEWAYTAELMHHAGTSPTTKAALLALWDTTTAEIDGYWPQIPGSRFEEVDTAFGQWEGVVYGLMQYWIDNEIHHRGQGYVYLRALGIEPPAFYERG
jgi:uncharacterized damage-inducible protein DinB